MSMIDVFLKGVGFDPTEFAQACEYYKKEFENMKSGVVQAVTHFGNEVRLIRETQARQEIQLQRIEGLLLDLATREVKPNGHDRTAERDDFSVNSD